LVLVGCRHEYTWGSFEPTPPPEDDHGLWLSADAAPGGGLAFAFYDRTRTALGFAVARNVGDVLSWDVEKVDGYPSSDGLDSGDRGTFCSMKVAPSGVVWISYHDATNGALRVVRRPTGSQPWDEPMLVDGGSGAHPRTGMFTSLAFDSAGFPVVAYHDDAAGTLRIAHTSDGTTWQTDTAWTGQPGPDGAAADVGEFASLVIVDGVESIAFYDRANGDLHLLQGTAGSYSDTVVDSTGDTGQWPSLWTDGTTLRIAYQEVTNQDLRLATRSGAGAFQIETVDDGLYRGADSALFERDGEPQIVYFDGHENNMMLATPSGSQWALTLLGGEDSALGFFNEVVQADGHWWAASYDYTKRQIFTRKLD